MYKNIRASELKGMLGRANIIDIRPSYLYNMGCIPGSKNIPSIYLTMFPDKYLSKDVEYYIYCSGGMNSPRICADLASKGYKVINVLGGYNDYITSL